MNKNEDLQRQVQEAIKWEPLLNAAEIGVIVKDGIVTLIGTVDSYAKKLEVEDAAKRVVGVKAVVEKIEIVTKDIGKIDDNEIAREIINAIKWNWKAPNNTITVKVENGIVTLGGEVKWNYQKETVQKSVKNLIGVKGLVNKITIKSEISGAIEKREVERALLRNWTLHNLNIKVNVSANKVVLTGTVNSLSQKEVAEKIAWNVPGVWVLENELAIDYNYSSSL